MADIEKMVAQLNELVAEGDSMALTNINQNGQTLAEASRLSNRLEAAIERICYAGSVYRKQLDLYRSTPILYRFPDVLSVAKALRDDLKAGWVESMVELVHSNTHSDYLEMADSLLTAKYKDPAAVITGTTLEVHVRALCVKHGVDTELPNGSPKKADTMNADLKKAGVYGDLQQKHLTAWMSLRNKAAHGKYEEYTDTEVRLLIQGIRDFMLRYPA